MVAFTFNMHGYTFQEGVQTLRASFMSARDALAADIERARDEALTYQQQVEQGGDWVGERDEDGFVIWDQADVLEMRIDTASEALNALRKAFVIALYHHWERSALRWIGKEREDHDTLTIAVQALGYPVDPKLAAVRDLVNTLKHDRDRWGLALMKSWSDLFDPDYVPSSTRNDWYQAIQVKDKHVLEVLGIVSGSGPTSKT